MLIEPLVYSLFSNESLVIHFSYYQKKLLMVTLYPTIKMAQKAEILPLIRSHGFLTILVCILHFTYMRHAGKKLMTYYVISFCSLEICCQYCRKNNYEKGACIWDTKQYIHWRLLRMHPYLSGKFIHRFLSKAYQIKTVPTLLQLYGFQLPNSP